MDLWCTFSRKIFPSSASLQFNKLKFIDPMKFIFRKH